MTCRTGAYQPPEQRAGDLGRHTDIYSLGVILYELLSGRLPFESDHDRSSHQRPRCAKGTTVDPSVAAICSKAMSLHPHERYATFDEFASVLAAQLLGTDQAVAGALPIRTVRSRRRSKGMYAVALAVSFAIGVAAVMLYLASGR